MNLNTNVIKILQLLIFHLDIGILSFCKKLSIVTKLNTTISIYGLNFDYFEKLRVIGIVINDRLAGQTEKKLSHDFKKRLQYSKILNGTKKQTKSLLSRRIRCLR